MVPSSRAEQANYSREQLLLGTHSPRINGLSLPELNLLKGPERLGAQVLTLVNLGDRSAAFVGDAARGQ